MPCECVLEYGVESVDSLTCILDGQWVQHGVPLVLSGWGQLMKREHCGKHHKESVGKQVNIDTFSYYYLLYTDSV